MTSAADVQPLLEALKAVAAALKAEGIPFALAGSYAVYARGGKDSRHDVDFVVLPGDVSRAKECLEQHGMKVFQPPEDWLFKAEYEGEPVDLIHGLSSGPVEESLLERAGVLNVESVEMPVMAATDLLVSKLLSLSEHACDIEPALSLMRSLREQLDVDAVVAATSGHPFAEAALYLAARLRILPVTAAPPALEEER